MEGFGLLIGHLLGDYLLQNDWQAKYKVAVWPVEPDTELVVNARSHGRDLLSEYAAARHAYYLGHLACTVHCVLYTLSVAACSWWWFPWWAILLTGLLHWPIDRFRLARKWMNWVGQKEFATGVLAPWSIIVVDNVIHLVTLFVLGMIVRLL